MSPVTFTVLGRAAQMGSKRIGRIKGRPVILDDNDEQKRNWANAVKCSAFSAMQGRTIIHEPVRLEVVFRFLRPQSHYGSGKNAGRLKASAPQHHTQSPDLDKLVRCLVDALTGVVWKDDRQVVQLVASREWTEGTECAQVVVSQFNNQEST